MIIRSPLSWAGHEVRMDDRRLSTQTMHSELEDRRRAQGGQHKWFKDTLTHNPKQYYIKPDNGNLQLKTKLAGDSPYIKVHASQNERNNTVKNWGRINSLDEAYIPIAGPTRLIWSVITFKETLSPGLESLAEIICIHKSIWYASKHHYPIMSREPKAHSREKRAERERERFQSLRIAWNQKFMPKLMLSQSKLMNSIDLHNSSGTGNHLWCSTWVYYFAVETIFWYKPLRSIYRIPNTRLLV